MYTIPKSIVFLLSFMVSFICTAADLQQAMEAKGKNYLPRTEHFNSDGSPKYINQLILSDSPYLLQHAHNPVDWYSWSEAAFAKAKAEQKPIFLSVGYSTCHWCHVMERESFENEKIAAYLNKHFIAIKVDREQHPDVDSYYMNALVRIQGNGGWPMSVFLLPNHKPFHGETYQPPEQFLRTLQTVQTLWQSEQAKVSAFAKEMTQLIDTTAAYKKTSKKINQTTLDKLVAAVLESHDDLQGGFSSAPKFPRENLLLFLLEHTIRHPQAALSEALTITLDAMAQGGIYDQVGGGFHRYATDNAWLVPHFEKMLYNQAMLARIYTKAWQMTGKPFYQRIARQTLDYVLRDLQDSKGGFYAATDADSGVEKKEGEYFTWTPQTLKAALGKADAKLAIGLFGVSEAGNFEGENILHLPISLTDFAKAQKMTLSELFSRFDKINQVLLATRNTRALPFLDKKIITAWNGLMVTALAEAAQVFGDKTYADAALRAITRIGQQYQKQDLPRISNSSQKTAATLNDYAFLLEAALALYDYKAMPQYLALAERLSADIQNIFLDKNTGDYFLNQKSKHLPRIKEPTDGAIYAGVAAYYRALHRLYQRTGNEAYHDAALALLQALATAIDAYPQSFAYLLAGHADAITEEVGNIRYAARGDIRLQLKALNTGYVIHITMAEGWHINSDQPLEKNLIATQVDSDTSLSLQYPRAVTTTLGFQKQPLSLFIGDTKIRLHAAKVIDKITVQLQACNDKQCLAPEKISFYPKIMQ